MRQTPPDPVAVGVIQAVNSDSEGKVWWRTVALVAIAFAFVLIVGLIIG